MANLRRPTREFSFSEHQRRSPTAPPPGNELDGVLADLRESLISTQDALAELRRDDGQLRNQIVGPEQLKPGLVTTITGDVTKITGLLQSSVRSAISAHTTTAADISLLARDAEAAATAAQRWLSQIQSIETRLLAVTQATEVNAAGIDTHVTDAENWSNYAQANAENAIAAKNEALAWAEYLAGPVVTGPDAPDFIRTSPYPHGLFYQPIDGAGGLGGLWSAKWWAIYVQQLVGWMSTFYLGAWDHHPAPGEVNPNTGMAVPNPIPVGSFYFNTIKKTLFFWTGDMWIAPFSLTGGVLSRYNYIATAGQTTFSGPDLFGIVPADYDADTEHDVHLNGVKLTRDDGTGKGDYTADAGTDSITLLFPVTAGSVVQWDLLVSADDLRPGAAVIFKIDPIVPDGVKTVFTLTYMSGTMSPHIMKPEEIWVTLDGVNQEPRTDYTAAEDQLTMYVPPSATSRIWAVYFRSGDLTALELAPPPSPVIILAGATVLENAAIGTVVGTFTINNPHTGTPTYLLSDDAGGRFTIVGNELRVAGTFDFETAISHAITVQVTGITPSSLPRVFNIVVQDVYEPVIGDIILTGNTVSEDAIIGATIGVFSTANTIGTPVFSLLDNAGGHFFVSGDSLRVAVPLDFLTASTYSITVRVSGTIPIPADETYIIIVTPSTMSSSIILSSNTVLENQAAGAIVGTLSITAGVHGTPTYTMVENGGGKFVLDGITIKTTTTLDYEAAHFHNVTIAVTGVSPNTPARTFQIDVVDVFENEPPVITSSASVANLENTTLAHTLTGTDEIGITWSIVGGADMAHFELVSGNVIRWAGGGTKDYETPGSSLGTNAYVLQVRATDPGGLFVNQTITVTVTDVSEKIWADFADGLLTAVSLFNSDVGVANTANVDNVAVASTAWKRSGKYYFECDNFLIGTGNKAGIAIEGVDAAMVATALKGVMGIGTGGSMFGQGFIGAIQWYGSNLGAWAQGTKMCFAVDLDNYKLWIRNGAAGLWNGSAPANPATNTGGMEIQYMSQARVAPFGTHGPNPGGANAAKLLFNLGQSAFVGAVPAGFTAGWSLGEQTALGHPTYTRIEQRSGGSNWIELGQRLWSHIGASAAQAGYLGAYKPDQSGKFYWEGKNYAAGVGDRYGLIVGDPFTFLEATYVDFQTGNIWSNGVNSGLTLPIINVGDTIGMAVDRMNRKVWFRGPNGLWNGLAIGAQNPATNTGGASISNNNAQVLAPYVYSQLLFEGARHVVNTGQQPFFYTLPAGFTGWERAPIDNIPPVITVPGAIANYGGFGLSVGLTANEITRLNGGWSIVGGADMAKFEFLAANGFPSVLRWAGNGSKNFSAPDDANGDNVYQVILRAADLEGNTTDKTINVTVAAPVSRAWTLVNSWTHSTNVAQVDFTGLEGYNEIRILVRGVTASVAGQRVCRFSPDGGLSYTAGSNYIANDGTGGTVSATSLGFHSTASTAARSGELLFSNWSLTGLKQAQARTRQTFPHFQIISSLAQGSAFSAYSAVRLLNVAAGVQVGEFTGGSIYVFGR